MKIRIITGFKFLPRGIAGMVLYPFVLFADNNPSKSLMIHELTHVSQVRKYGFISFYLSYGLYYLANLIRYKDHFRAYLEIPYEVEAREAEENGHS